MTIRLAETTPLSEAGTTTTAGRMKVHAITAGVGSSGYYSPDVLREAATNVLIDKGTPLYLDHPTKSGRVDRPERSVRDIAGVFTEAATFDETEQALVGEIQVFSPYRDLLSEMAPYIGLSITGSATDVVDGEVDGTPVKIVEGIAKVNSVDFVTQAGRGGRVVELLESARAEAFTEDTARLQLAEARNIGQWIESRLHLELTRIADDMFGDGRLTREERIALSSAVGDGLTAFTAALEDRAPALYTRDLWAEPEQMLVAEEARRNVPVTRPGSKKNPINRLKEHIMSKIEIEESEHTRLVAEAGRVAQLQQETATKEARIAELEEAEARRVRTDRAVEIVEARAKEAGVTFTPREVKGLLADITVTESGDLDEAAFTALVDTDAAAKKAEAGSGQVRGHGGTVVVTESGNGSGGIGWGDIDSVLGIAEQKGA